MSTTFHPIAEIFPLMSDAQLEELAADIAENGLHEPIWRHEGQIIDGRNRYLACMKCGVVPTYREWEGNGNGDLIKFVVSVNVHRRHLNESQRAMIAAKLANRIAGMRDSNIPIGIFTLNQKDAQSLLNVGHGSLGRARQVLKNAAPEIVDAVASGEIRLNKAVQFSHAPRNEQTDALKAERHKNTKVKTRSLPKTNVAKAIRNAIGTLIGITSSLTTLDAKDANLTADEAKQFDDELVGVVATIRRLRRQLMEVFNGN